MSSASFRRLATVTASTRRSPTIVGSKRSGPVINLTGLRCTPIDPLDEELRERLGLQTAHELLQTLVDDAPDVREGDVLVVGSTEYPIRAVADWAWRSSTYRVLILEGLKR